MDHPVLIVNSFMEKVDWSEKSSQVHISIFCILVKGIDGVDQWMTISKGLPSARSEFVYNINELTGSAAIR